MTKRKQKILLYGICFVIFIIAISPFVMNAINSQCNAFTEFLNTPYNGIVANKYVNFQNHSAQTVQIKNLKYGYTTIWILDFNVTNFYESININDTIFKEIGKDTVYIINKAGKQPYVIDYGCKN